MIVVCCDSGAQLPAELAAAHGIEVIPLSVSIDDVDHLEGVNLDADAFWARFEDGHVPRVTTAAPSPGRIAATYQRLADLGANAIVSIHTGAELSSTLNAARIAAEASGVPVELVDTQSASFVVGCAALAAADAVAAGASADEAAQQARTVAARCGNVFVVGALDLARAGGRLAADVAEPHPGGPVPVLRLADGKITVVGEARSSDEAAELMAAEILVSGARMRVGIGVADSAAEPLATDLRRRLEGSGRAVELLEYRVGPSVGAHTGPGTAGAVYHPL